MTGGATLSDRVKATVSLRDLAERSGVTWDAGKSRIAAGDHWAPCPFHGESTASFHVVEPKGVGGWFKCFGCDAKGSVVDFLMIRDGIGPAEALKRLADSAGIESGRDDAALKARLAELERRRARAEVAAEAQAAARLDRARAIWREAEPAGSPAAALLDAYLRARGVRLDAIGGVPPTLRLHRALEYWLPGQDRRRERPAHVGPAMVAAIGRAGPLVGIHRTWITAEGRARLADGAKVPKMILGRTGAIFGEPIRLSPPTAGLVVGEGIETTLAAFAGLIAAGKRGWSAEAAVSLGALAGPEAAEGKGPGLTSRGAPLPSPIPDLASAAAHWLPGEGVRAVLILGEGSSRDPEAARRHGLRARAKLEARGFEVRLVVPGNDWSSDRDFADVAKESDLWG